MLPQVRLLRLGPDRRLGTSQRLLDATHQLTRGGVRTWPGTPRSLEASQAVIVTCHSPTSITSTCRRGSECGVTRHARRGANATNNQSPISVCHFSPPPGTHYVAAATTPQSTMTTESNGLERLYASHRRGPREAQGQRVPIRGPGVPIPAGRAGLLACWRAVTAGCVRLRTVWPVSLLTNSYGARSLPATVTCKTPGPNPSHPLPSFGVRLTSKALRAEAISSLT